MSAPYVKKLSLEVCIMCVFMLHAYMLHKVGSWCRVLGVYAVQSITGGFQFTVSRRVFLQVRILYDLLMAKIAMSSKSCYRFCLSP